MCEVALTLRLMPLSPEVDLAAIEGKVREHPRVRSVSREPIAYGLTALRVVAVVRDEAGASDEVEEALVRIPGVGSVQVIEVTRLLQPGG